MKIFNQQLDDGKIYYYCKREIALENILLNKQLLLSPIINTNDPRENKALWFSYTHSKNTFPPLSEMNTKFSSLVRNNCKVICFSQDYRKNLGCHLSNMWAHYGQNHHGICLQIDLKKFLEENKEVFEKSIVKKVTYQKFDKRNRPPQPCINIDVLEEQGEEEYIKSSFIPINRDYLFFTKGEEWESESEIRLLYFSDTTDKEYCSINHSLESIRLGIDFEHAYLPSVKHLAEGKSIYQINFLPDGLKSVAIT